MGENATISLRNRLTNVAARVVLGGAMLVPYERRVRLVGWIFSRLVAPVAGWQTRIRDSPRNSARGALL